MKGAGVSSPDLRAKPQGRRCDAECNEAEAIQFLSVPVLDCFVAENAPRNDDKESGFTLIEVLVSMIIFVILSAIAYGGLTSILRSREYAEAHLNRLQALQRTFLYLKRDIEQVVLRPTRDELGEELPPLKGGGISGIFLEWSRAGWNNPANLPRSTLQRVAYDYTGDKLYRVSWRVLDRAPDTKPVRRSLLEGVKHIEVRFMDNDLQTHDHWPLEDKKETQEEAKLPRAIALTLEVEGMGEFKRLFSIANGA